MRRSGELVQWNNKGGYGFARDETGKDYYVHISAVADGARPKQGDKVSFDIGKGRKGKPAAKDVIVTSVAPAPTPRERQNTGVSPLKVGLRTATATIMTLLILWAVAAGQLPVWLCLPYALMGGASALLYRFDKRYAISGRYRVSETNLHVVDLCFGIIGGLSAQEVYRHKTVKPRFVATTWAIALLHLVGLSAFAFGWHWPLLGVLVR